MKTQVRAEWSKAVLVCRKCSKRVGRRFGADGATTLPKALRQAVGGGKGRKARVGIVEVGCLKVCPKHAVAVVDTSAPGRWQLVQSGTSMEALVERLGLDVRTGL